MARHSRHAQRRTLVEHSDDPQERHTLEEFLFALLARNELHEHAAKSLVALLANAIGRASQELIDRAVTANAVA